MIALIFGANGQDGQYLSLLLKKDGIAAISISRSSGDHLGDVANYSFVEFLINKYKPYYIFHLAANSSTAHTTLFENHATICSGTLNILECTRLYSPQSKVFISGSAMQFQNAGMPIDEKTSFEASSPYSIARIQSVYAARYYRLKFNMHIYCGYFFNHDSPYRSERHVNKKITAAVLRIKNGSDEKLELGNIKVKKEFNFSGDVIAAAWLLINQHKIYEAVIGSGETYSIENWLEYCFKKINKNWEDYVILNPSYVPEYSILVSNPTLIKSLNWKPKISFEKLADIMMQP